MSSLERCHLFRVSFPERLHCVQDSQLGPSTVLYREVPLYTGQPAGSQLCPLQRGSTVQSSQPTVVDGALLALLVTGWPRWVRTVS